MFGLDKLKDLKKNAEAVKSKLEQMEVEGSAGNNLVVVTCNGAREILNMNINESVHRTAEKDVLEKLIVEACNDALQKAEAMATEEMKGIMPNIPGLGL